MKKLFLLFVASAIIFAGCRKDPVVAIPELHDYPEEPGSIIIRKCATAGCHTSQSAPIAGGLDLSTWDAVFKGGKRGAVIVPFQPEFSSFFLLTNEYPELGSTTQPVHSPHRGLLEKNEAEVLRNWILAGARGFSGKLRFGKEKRKKVYLTNQACDLVSVMDAESGLLMKVINVGSDPLVNEGPHLIKVSPDGNSFYVCFTNGRYLERYLTSDEKSGSIFLGEGNWNTFSISSDGTKAFVVDWSADGRIAFVDLEQGETRMYYQGSGLFSYPHGSALSPDDKFLYVTAQSGKALYKINVANPYQPEIDEIALSPGNPSLLQLPHEVAFAPSGDKYFVTAQGTNEVYVKSYPGDATLAVVPTGIYPQEIAFSESFAFVTCTEDTVNGKNGVVSVIDMNTLSLVKNIPVGWQPHGIAVSKSNGNVYVASRNIDAQGPPPHHSTACGGRNSFLNIINSHTLEVLEYHHELPADAYSIAVREW